MTVALSLTVAIAGCRASVTGTQAAIPRHAIVLARFRNDSTAFSMYSGLGDSVRLVVRDSRQWGEYWRRINSPFFPPPAQPPIDFAREMVVVAALGRRPSLGYDIVIDSAARDSAGIAVYLRRSNPGARCPLPAALTQPVDLARMPASDLPLRFTELISTIPCGEH